jgi:hypothetical protein
MYENNMNSDLHETKEDNQEIILKYVNFKNLQLTAFLLVFLFVCYHGYLNFVTGKIIL